MATRHTDVIIAGGGLAGLGLARQLKQSRPELDITVVEKRRFPLPRAIAKVGESTVEIGSHYLSHDLRLSEHLTHHQLRKNGLRMFFGGQHGDFAQADELGSSQAFEAVTYQLDRGLLENHMAETLAADGVTIESGVDLELTQLEPTPKVRLRRDDQTLELSGKWLLDASGRRALIRQQRGLTTPSGHTAHAVWFRVQRRIQIDDWSADQPWRQRCRPAGERWLSTNHLMGPGYWVWLIPLSGGYTSIGIVMDDTAFAQSGISDDASARAWLAREQPHCAAAVAGADSLDFVMLKDYSYKSSEIYGAGPWAITGEAGMFADPLYSPGTDLIAISNTFITDLVSDDCAGRDINLKRAVYRRFFFDIFNNTLAIYRGQYGGFGDRVMMGAKLMWDYVYYWGILSPLYFRQALTDLKLLRDLSPLLTRAQALNFAIQERLRARAALRLTYPAEGRFANQHDLACLQQVNHTLVHGTRERLAHDLAEHVAMMEILSKIVIELLEPHPSATISATERQYIGDYRSLLLA